MSHKDHGFHSTKAWRRAKRAGRRRHVARMMRHRTAAVNRDIRAIYEQWQASHPWAAPWRSPRRLLVDRLPMLASHPDPIHQAWDRAYSGERYVNLDAIGIWVDGANGEPSGYLIPQSAQEALLEELTLLRPPVRSMPGIAPTLTYRDLVGMFPPPAPPEIAQWDQERRAIVRLFGIPPDLVHPRYAKIAPIQEDVPDGPPQDA